MISPSTKEILQKSSNLLAFSYGTDSTALFFILLKSNIDFDIVMVDYGLRKQSKDEVSHAKKLAEKHNKKIYLAKSPIFSSNFEKNARDFRHNFFKQTAISGGYNNIILAHQLNDKLEWLLMRLSKGTDLCSIFGMKEIEQRDGFCLVRPILHVPKAKILQYLEKNNILYFVDKSNHDENYERNFFRHNMSDLMVEKFPKGIERSFELLQKDCEFLLAKPKIAQVKQLFILEKTNPLTDLKHIDRICKKLGVLLSHKTKNDISSGKKISVISRKIAFGHNEKYIFICPCAIAISLPKEFKEICRKAKLPPTIRGYILALDLIQAVLKVL